MTVKKAEGRFVTFANLSVFVCHVFVRYFSQGSMAPSVYGVLQFLLIRIDAISLQIGFWEEDFTFHSSH
jgi:hypothetical protein